MKRYDGAIKGHPKGKKNLMRSLEEKEAIVRRCLDENIPFQKLGKELGITDTSISTWVRAYEMNGVDGLKSKTGKCGSGNPYSALFNKKNLTEIERLRLELVKKEVECERLKKGYTVKGVGRRKEYVTINKKNSK
ncbi:MAG TPA: transposase [Bacilli bacterium]|nr:transposase [Bacilli bacterium]